MFEVGQKLWFVRSEKRSGEPREVTVEKAGRVWATLSNGLRCDATGKVDGGQYQSPGHCYESRETYDMEQARLNAWWKFKRGFEHKQMPEALTIEALAQIAASLEI